MGGEAWEGRCGSRGVGGEVQEDRHKGEAQEGRHRRGGAGGRCGREAGYKAGPLMDYKVVPHPTS